MNRSRFPMVTTAVIGTALLVHAWPALGALLIYDRQAILRGELWRAVTGHWVHFSASHLTLDALVLGVAGARVELTDRRQFVRLMVTGSMLIGVGLLALQPELGRYGGLSGLATAAVASIALGALRQAGASRRLGLAILALMTLKFAAELAGGAFIFTSITSPDIQPCPLSHALGAATAVLLWLWHCRPVVPVGTLSACAPMPVRASIAAKNGS